eukprot:3151617-Alexandrium_andersonii.AAC.1
MPRVSGARCSRGPLRSSCKPSSRRGAKALMAARWPHACASFAEVAMVQAGEARGAAPRVRRREPVALEAVAVNVSSWHRHADDV